MVGSALAELAWGYQNAGFGIGILVSFLAFSAGAYTCILIVKTTDPNDTDYAETIERYFGKLEFKQYSFV